MRYTLFVAIFPALLLVYLFKKWDEKRPEPPGMVRNAVIFGMISCIPAAFLEIGETYALGKPLVEAHGQLVNSFAIAAGTEEDVKLAIVMLIFWRKEAFNEVMDGILYTAAVSLGFALLENIMYSAGNIITGFARAISAVPLHATASGIMGYFIGRAKMNGSALGRVLLGYACAVAIHGFYDWTCFSGGKYGFDQPNPLLGFGIAVGIVICMGVVLRTLIKRALAEDDKLLGPQARPLQAAVPYHLMQHPHFAGQFAPYGHAHWPAPQPYGMHAPYAGHMPAPQPPPQGYHQPHQPHQYPGQVAHPHGHAPGYPQQQQGYPQHQGYQQPQAPQNGYPPQQAPSQQGGWGQGGGWPSGGGHG